MTTETLMNGLFQQIDNYNDTLETKNILPNFQGGFNIQDSNGELLTSFQPGVMEGAGSIVDATGNTIAHVREGISGTVVDYGQGDTVTIEDSLDGEIFKDNFGETLGYSNPGIMGENYNFSNGDSFTLSENPIGEGFVVDQNIPFDLHDFDAISVTDASLESFNSLSDIEDVMGSLDMGQTASDGLDTLDFLTGFL